MPGDAQSQTQTQQQTITITAASSGDPELERRIFSEVQSAGRQLRNISAVVEVLLAAHEAADSSFASSGSAHDAIQTFREMQLQILRAKSLRDPDRLIDQLEALRRVDAQAFGALRDRLNQWLPGK
jgi:hypothetical protein